MRYTTHRQRPINLAIACKPIQQCKVDQVPDACLLPVAHPTPARHPRPTPEFLRQHLPGDAAAEDKQNAGETRAIRDARPSAFRSTWWSGKERFDKIPQRIWKQRRGHTPSRYLANESQVAQVLLRALSFQMDVANSAAFLCVMACASFSPSRQVQRGERS